MCDNWTRDVPQAVQAAALELRRCVRVLPTQGDGGGFFIALLERSRVPGKNKTKAATPEAEGGTGGGPAIAESEEDLEPRQGMGGLEGLQGMGGLEVGDGGGVPVAVDTEPPPPPHPVVVGKPAKAAAASGAQPPVSASAGGGGGGGGGGACPGAEAPTGMGGGGGGWGQAGERAPAPVRYTDTHCVHIW